MAINQQGLITFGTGSGDATATLQVNDSAVDSLAIPGSSLCSPGSTIGLSLVHNGTGHPVKQACSNEKLCHTMRGAGAINKCFHNKLAIYYLAIPIDLASFPTRCSFCLLPCVNEAVKTQAGYSRSNEFCHHEDDNAFSSFIFQPRVIRSQSSDPIGSSHQSIAGMMTVCPKINFRALPTPRL